jgi:hypothetical protein
MREATGGGRYLGEKGQESHKLRSKSRVTQVVMVSRELVKENRFREGIATLGIATLATLLSRESTSPVEHCKQVAVNLLNVVQYIRRHKRAGS